MAHGIARAAVTVGIGVLAAGPLAAIAYAGAPDRWRNALIPFAALAVAVLIVAWVRGRGDARAEGASDRPPTG
jgi:hypothetical protein